jgi:hypothetical protein
MNKDVGLRHCRLRFMNRRQYTKLLKSGRLRMTSLQSHALSNWISAASQAETQEIGVPVTMPAVAITPAPEVTQQASVGPIANSVVSDGNAHPAYLPQPGPAESEPWPPQGQPMTDEPAFEPTSTPHTNHTSVSSPGPLGANVSSAPAPVAPVDTAADDDQDDNNLFKVIKKIRTEKARLEGGAMKWMPEKLVYGVAQALKDLRSANRSSKKRLFAKQRPTSLTGSVKVATRNYEGFMAGDKKARSQRSRDWINAYMQLVLEIYVGRKPEGSTLAPPSPRPMPQNGAAAAAAAAAADDDDDDTDGGDAAATGGDDDGQTETVEEEEPIDDGMIPAELAMGPDEVGGGVHDYTVYEFYHNSDTAPPTDDQEETGPSDQATPPLPSVDPAEVASMIADMNIQQGSSSSSS